MFKWLIGNEFGTLNVDPLDDVLQMVAARKGSVLKQEVASFIVQRYIEMSQDNDGSLSPDLIKNNNKNIGV